MSHFVGFVFGNNVNELLAPYNENMEVNPYIAYTKDEAVDDIKRRHTNNYEYAIKFVDSHKNPTTDLEKEQLERANKIIEKGLFISYGDAWKEAKNLGYEIDEDENLMSTYNPNSKWDWYCEGGRWGAWLLIKEKGEDGKPLNVISATKEEIDWDAMLEEDRIPFCFVTENGDWHESASMGWWAMTTNNKDENVWRKEFLDYLESVENGVEITVIDFHI